MKSRFSLAAAMLLLAGSATAQTAAPLAVGTMAPDFSLAGATKDGALATPAKLSDFRGQTVVLAFYPKARTSGCTIQMTAYRDKYATLFNDGKGVVLLAISVDPVPDLVSWASDKQLPFRLLSDSGGTVGKVYGAYKADWKMNSRTLFVIDPDGKITYVAAPFQEIDPAAYVTLGQEIGKVGKKG